MRNPRTDPTLTARLRQGKFYESLGNLSHAAVAPPEPAHRGRTTTGTQPTIQTGQRNLLDHHVPRH
jgi:hypothetical protein